MKRFIPSPAMAVAMAALFLVGGGSAIAAKKYVVKSSSQVKNGSLTLADFKKADQAKLKGANGANGANGADATKLWAVVDNGAGTPTLTRGKGATGVTDVGVGTVTVAFDQSVVGCSYVASAGSSNDTSFLEPYVATTELENIGTSPNKIRVRVWDVIDSADTPRDADFSLQVAC